MRKKIEEDGERKRRGRREEEGEEEKVALSIPCHFEIYVVT